MAHKDYVSRGRSKKKAPPPPKKKLPWIRILITTALVAGFVVFLYTIKNSAEQPETVVQKETTEIEQLIELPDIPEEEWEFFTLLPQQTVTVEQKEQELSDRRYLMQCASFRDKRQAEEMQATIAFQGLEPQVRASNGSNGLWYRVILGPYELKRAAEKDRHTLQRININTCQIWYWNL